MLLFSNCSDLVFSLHLQWLQCWATECASVEFNRFTLVCCHVIIRDGWRLSSAVQLKYDLGSDFRCVCFLCIQSIFVTVTILAVVMLNQADQSPLPEACLCGGGVYANSPSLPSVRGCLWVDRANGSSSCHVTLHRLPVATQLYCMQQTGIELNVIRLWDQLRHPSQACCSIHLCDACYMTAYLSPPRSYPWAHRN